MGRPMAEAARKLTYEDYCRIPEDGKRHEIIDGVEYVSPSPSEHHQGLSGNYYAPIRAFLQRTRLGVVRYAPLDVLLGKHDIVQPDLFVVLAPNLARLKKNGCHGPPDLVIEILSPSNPAHDVVRKRRLYEKAGVPEYWIVDPPNSRLEVYRRAEGGKYGRPLVLTVEVEDVLETPLLPGFAAPLVELFDRGLMAPVEE